MTKANIRQRRKLSLHVKCTLAERERWLTKARSHGLNLSDYLREFLEVSQSSRRRPPPPVNPLLIMQVARAGNNLNQIAKVVNGALRHGDEIDTIAVLAELVAVDRVLNHLTREHSL